MTVPCTLDSQGEVFLGLPLALPAPGCQLSRRHLSFSGSQWCVGSTSPGMCSAWCAQLPGWSVKHSHCMASSGTLTSSNAKLCSISSNTACWTLPKLAGNSKCSIKMLWPSVSKDRWVGEDRRREGSGESLHHLPVPESVCKGAGEGPFTRKSTDRTWGNGFTLKESRFGLDIRKEF